MTKEIKVVRIIQKRSNGHRVFHFRVFGVDPRHIDTPDGEKVSTMWTDLLRILVEYNELENVSELHHQDDMWKGSGQYWQRAIIVNDMGRPVAYEREQLI